MSVYHAHAWCPRRPEEGVKSPEAGASESCELTHGCWKWSLVPLEEQPAPFTTELLLQLHAQLFMAFCTSAVIFVLRRPEDYRGVQSSGTQVFQKSVWSCSAGAAEKATARMFWRQIGLGYSWLWYGSNGASSPGFLLWASEGLNPNQEMDQTKITASKQSNPGVG